MKSRSKVFVLTASLLLALQALTILSSWIVNALWPALGIRSLLSGSGLRWLLGGCVSDLSGETLVWMLIGCVLTGCLVWSELPKKIIRYSKNDYRERFAVDCFFLTVAVGVVLCAIMAAYPRSSLLSVSGHLFPGPFAKAAAIVIGMAIFVGSVVFSLLTRKIKNCETAEKACVFGLEHFGPVMIVYVLLKQFIGMVRFVMS
ncbi:MAG: hypothetical protein HUK20_09640 [Fibrobacter sp.]|nr:hypothetical protein [Fibrobacter sp.]